MLFAPVTDFYPYIKYMFSVDSEQAQVYTDEQIAEIIDGVFIGMDTDNDGLIDFAEYTLGRDTI